MEIDEHLRINLNVANRSYPIRIKRTEEEAYRKAADEINFKLAQYKSHFVGDDSQTLLDADYITMTAIQAVVDKKKLELQVEYYEKQLKEISQKLENYIQKNIR